MKIILLIIIGLSLVQGKFLRDDTKDVVLDSQTKLMWQDNRLVENNWTDAIIDCENLNLNSFDDWRLANINELKTLLDRSKVDPAMLDGFKFKSSNLYWSSTTYEGGKYHAWSVNFNSGDVDYTNKESITYVRCVRDTQ